MRNLEKELKNKFIDFDKLVKYGFVKQEDKYIFKTKLCDNQFEMIVIFSANEKVSKILDLTNNDEYILVDIPGSTGEFVGKVRKEYESRLQDIIDKCSIFNIYKSEQAKEVIQYVKTKYDDDLEHLWEKSPQNAIWRNKINKKWYGALLVVSESKLGLDSDKLIEIIDLRYQKENIKTIIDNKKVYPGYHMNKDSWITIKLDNSMSLEQIFELLDNSYKISLGR